MNSVNLGARLRLLQRRTRDSGASAGTPLHTPHRERRASMLVDSAHGYLLSPVSPSRFRFLACSRGLGRVSSRNHCLLRPLAPASIAQWPPRNSRGARRLAIGAAIDISPAGDAPTCRQLSSRSSLAAVARCLVGAAWLRTEFAVRRLPHPTPARSRDASPSRGPVRVLLSAAGRVVLSSSRRSSESLCCVSWPRPSCAARHPGCAAPRKSTAEGSSAGPTTAFA